MSHYTCSSCSVPHELFGSSKNFLKAATDLKLPVLGESTYTTAHNALHEGEGGVETDIEQGNYH